MKNESFLPKPGEQDRVGTQIPALSEQAEFYRSLQAIEEFAASLRRHSGRYIAPWECVLRTIAKLTVGDRPNRKEPRQVKRRPKPYKLLQSARKSIRTREATMS
ncbi:hypothetical protein DTL42_25895 [Bremerella cremea]|uniref:Uncharacterized protein n=1 Tax=Bremerella cremea TaxID=1031537 RepID=A0A368KJP5_9BACT|nr:hypothetical protein DTL42_25895 [Bremerella cremea]